jgi:hypothetical protein
MGDLWGAKYYVEFDFGDVTFAASVKCESEDEARELALAQILTCAGDGNLARLEPRVFLEEANVFLGEE